MKRDESDCKGLVLITGINGSIGSEIARLLLEKETDVIGIFNRGVDDINEVYKKIKTVRKGTLHLLTYQNLVNKKFNELEATIARFDKRITGIVHTAASVPYPKKFEQLELGDFQNEFDVQIGSFQVLLSYLLNKGLVAGDLSVVGISTIYAHNIPPSMLSVYVAIKSALNGLFRALAVEYGPIGMRFNLVSPGMTESKMLIHVPDRARLVAKMSTPLRRLGRPDDIAPIVEFLLSEKASHITGQNISVSGGLSI